jgi:nicotinamidase-related amidase
MFSLKSVLGFLLVAMAAVAPMAAEEAEQPTPPVLIIVDIQGFYFEGGAVPLEGSAEASQVAKKVLARFRALGWPVVHVQHLPKGQDETGQAIEPEAYRIHQDVAPQPGETVIGKHHANAFRDTGLLATLRELGAHRLVILGMQTHMCLEAATRAAADLGFEVTVVHDACATRALEFGGSTVPAAQVHASTLATLEGTYARVVSADELLAELEVPE